MNGCFSSTGCKVNFFGGVFFSAPKAQYQCPPQPDVKGVPAGKKAPMVPIMFKFRDASTADEFVNLVNQLKK